MYLANVTFFSVITSIVLGQGNDLENRLQLLEEKITALEEKNSAFGNKFETSKLALTDGLASVENVVDELKIKLSELEEVTNILRVEESCAALGKLGYTQTGTYPIDPDGKSQNLPPVQAFCSLPDGKTSIGGTKQIQIEHCIANLCFQSNVSYDVPLGQMKALVKSSKQCSQEITLKCLLAPTKSNGIDHMKWIDSMGGEHTMTGAACNTNIPALASQSNTITDKTILPIAKVLYGPLVHVGQSGVIEIGPLTCLPFDENPTQNNENITEIIQNINSSIFENHPPKPPCPVEKSNVYLIEGNCFVFDKTARHKDNTKAYCASAFGEHLLGRIHEPRSRSIQNAVLSKWNTFAPGSHCHWLGINDNQSEGTWRYDSDDSKIAFSSWKAGEPNDGASYNCAYQHYSAGAKWEDYTCGSAGCFSLCELE